MNIAEIEITYKTSTPYAEKPQIRSTEDAHEILRELFPNIEHRERLVMLPLNKANRVLGSYTLSVGGIAGTVCDPVIVFQVCLSACAKGFIIAHNHPSGNLQPSQDDIELSRKLREGGKILGITLIDHIILTEENYLSMNDEGLI